MNADDINRTAAVKIKHVFKTALRCIEIKFGNEFDGYEQMRSEILRAGNNAIRELREVTNEAFGIEDDYEPTKVRIVNRERNHVK